MQYQFLADFSKRQHVIARNAVVFFNCEKNNAEWQKYGIDDRSMRISLIFWMLNYIMVQTLKETTCTETDLSDFIYHIDREYLHNNLDLIACRELCRFIIDKVLKNSKKEMSFTGYDFSSKSLKELTFDYIESYYPDGTTNSLSYRMTTEGFALIFSTYEVENNMRISMEEIRFNEKLNLMDYEQALVSIDNILDLLRIELRKFTEATEKIKRNIFNMSESEYKERNDSTFSSLKRSFEKYKENEEYIQLHLEDKSSFSNEETHKKLEQLVAIREKLEKVLGLQSSVLASLDTYRNAIDKAYEDSWEIQMDDFVPFEDILDQILSNGDTIKNLDILLHPFFVNTPDKIFNPSRAFARQTMPAKIVKSPTMKYMPDIDKWREEQIQAIADSNASRRACLLTLLNVLKDHGFTTLSQICAWYNKDVSNQQALIFEVTSFRDVLLALAYRTEFVVEHLHTHEATDNLTKAAIEEILLSIVNDEIDWNNLSRIRIQKICNAPEVVFTVPDIDDNPVNITCSELSFSLTWR